MRWVEVLNVAGQGAALANEAQADTVRIDKESRIIMLNTAGLPFRANDLELFVFGILFIASEVQAR